MTPRRQLIASLAAFPAALVAACAGSGRPGTGATDSTGAGGDQKPATSARRVTLTAMSHTASEADAFNQIFETLRKSHPEITVDFSAGTTGGANTAYNEKLVSLVASGDAPDVFKTAPFGFGQLAAGGAYLQLDDYVKRSAAQVKVDDFFPSHYEGSKYRGKLFALPQTGAPQAIWINVDAWQREGLPLPGWDTTWADFLRGTATALTKRDDTGAATQLGTGRPDWVSWIWSAGGDLYNEEGTRMLIDQPPALEALAWLQDAVNRHRIAPNAQEQGDSTLTMLENGKLSTAFGNRGALGRYQSINGFTFDAAPLPKGPRGRVAQTAVGHTSIWSSSKSKDAAFLTLTFLCSTEAQQILIGSGTAHPSRKSSTEQSWFKDFKPPRAASTRVNTTFPDTLIRKEARAITPHPREAEINQAILSNLGALWNGTKPPRDVAAAIVAETSSLMAK